MRPSSPHPSEVMSSCKAIYLTLRLQTPQQGRARAAAGFILLTIPLATSMKPDTVCLGAFWLVEDGVLPVFGGLQVQLEQGSLSFRSPAPICGGGRRLDNGARGEVSRCGGAQRSPPSVAPTPRH